MNQVPLRIDVTLRRSAAATLLALALLGATAQAPAGAGPLLTPSYIPAGVTDVEGTVGCLRTPEGGVEAVDLATGRPLWRSAAPARALLVDPGRAFVLEERTGRPLRVAAYTAREGRLLRAYDLTTLELPPWASLGGAAEGREWTVFDVAARLAGGDLEVRYDVTRRRVSGFVAPGVVGRVEGVVRISVASGRIDRRSGPSPAPPPISEPMSPMQGARLVAVHARASDATVVMGGPPPDVQGALVAGDRRFAFEMSRDTKTIIVHRWSASGGGRRTMLRLEHGRATDAVWATLDRRHVLLRRASEQQWHDLYSLETGEPNGSLERPADVAVIGPRIYWTTLESDGDLVLLATETASGRTLWRRTVLEPDRRKMEPIP